MRSTIDQRKKIMRKIRDYDEAKVTQESQEFARRLFSRFPELRAYAAMARWNSKEPWTLQVTVLAPSGDPKSELGIWMSGGEPSVYFGGWHTHEGVWIHEVNFISPQETEDSEDPILDLVERIMSERYVSCIDVNDDGAESELGAGIFDISNYDAPLEEITQPHCTDRVRLRSWKGTHDRLVKLSVITMD